MKRAALISFLLLGLITVSFGEECADQHTCNNCAQTDGCGWCDRTASCHEGNDDGPSTGFCIDSWVAQPNMCDECKAASSCNECIKQDICCWHDSDKKCQKITLGGSNCYQYCNCHDYPTCTSCLESEHCDWCASAGKDDSCMGIKEVCPGNISATCPCDGHDCDSCVTNDDCVWCNRVRETMFVCEDKSIAETDKCERSETCEDMCRDLGTNCPKCRSINGCGWCPELRSCVDLSQSDCIIEDNCITDCSIYSSCDACVSKTMCGWCGDENLCVDPNENPYQDCPLVHTCEHFKSAFNFGSFLAGMFTVVGGSVVAFGCFVFYKRKKAHDDYTEVN